MKESGKIKIVKNGPYLIENLPLKKEITVCGKNGIPEKWKEEGEIKTEKSYALCRCGNSKKKPFCDGSHMKGFDGSETASMKKFDECCEIQEGENINLKDYGILCSGAGFCHGSSGTWDLAMKKDKKSNDLAIQQCANCPSGRLVAQDKKTNKDIEPKFEQCACIAHHDKELAGPIWVKGSVPIISAKGKEYEKRNRVTLCRCGKSSNKPFCDGSHIQEKFGG